MIRQHARIPALSVATSACFLLNFGALRRGMDCVSGLLSMFIASGLARRDCVPDGVYESQISMLCS